MNESAYCSESLIDKTDLTTNTEEHHIVEQLLQELQPLYRLLHALVLICQYQGLKPGKPRNERYFDPGTKLHVAFDLPYIKYFLAHVFQFQIFDILCQQTDHQGPLHLCDLYDSVAAGNKLKILLELGSSKPWEDILEEFAGVRTFSAKSCLRYFQPLQDYLEELVKQGQLNIGWTCNNKSNSRREKLFRKNYFLFIFMNFILSIS